MSTMFRHDPDAVLDYPWDWALWLDDDETIVSQTVTVATGEATIDSVTQTGGTVIAFVSGAVTPLVELTCQVVTSQGRTDDRTITLRVRDR